MHPDTGEGSGRRERESDFSVLRNVSPTISQSLREPDPEEPPLNLYSAFSNTRVYPNIFPPRNEGEVPRGNSRASAGEQSILSIPRPRNRPITGNPQPEVVVPRSPRRAGGQPSNRVRENAQREPISLDNNTLNEGSGATIQSSYGEQEGFALYGDIHDAINQGHPLPRNMGLYHVGYDAGFGGFPITVRLATNIHNFVLDVTLPDRTNIFFGPPDAGANRHEAN